MKVLVNLLAQVFCAAAIAATANVGILNVGNVSTGSGGGGEDPPQDDSTFGTGVNAFSIEFVTIDDVGNPGKLITFQRDGTNFTRACGSLDYVYRISKYAQSEDQVQKATNAGQLPITVSTLGTNMPATKVGQEEAFHFINYLCEAKGAQVAYYFSPSGVWGAWPDTNVWFQGTNGFRHKDAPYWMPSADEFMKAGMWNKATQQWGGWGQGTVPPTLPTPVNGWFLNGSTNTGTAVYAQRFFDAFPEIDSPGNVVEVDILVDGSGIITNIAFSAYISGHAFDEDTTNAFRIIQGGISNATARVATFQTISNVPGTFTNYVGGAGYVDGPATITLAGNTVDVTLITRDGQVFGAIPTGGRFATKDTTTTLSIVQAGGSNATCRVVRYASDTYNAPRVPLTFTLVSGGTGYTSGTAQFKTQDNEYHLTLDPNTGVAFYKRNLGAAEVDRAGGPSPFGVVGLFGNTSTMTDTADDWVNDGVPSTSYPYELFKYFGGWWQRGNTPSSAAQWENGGIEAWNPYTGTEGAYANGFRVCARAP